MAQPSPEAKEKRRISIDYDIFEMSFDCDVPETVPPKPKQPPAVARLSALQESPMTSSPRPAAPPVTRFRRYGEAPRTSALPLWESRKDSFMGGLLGEPRW